MPAEGSGAVTPLCVSQGAELLWDALGQEDTTGAAVAQRLESALHACAIVPGIVLAKSGIQPQLPGPFLPSESCDRSTAVPSQLHWDPGKCARHLLLLNLLSCWHKVFRRGSGVPAAASCWVSVFLSCF